MRERDTQRARVYKSDAALVAIAKPLPQISDMTRYVKRIAHMKRVSDAFPGARLDTWFPKIGDGRGRRSACGWSGGMSMPVASRNEAIVIHELAHVICQRLYDWKVAGHGWQFCSIYLQLTLYAMGREAHDTLKRAFKANRVRYTAPRKRAPLSPERRAELAERLATFRRAKRQTVPVTTRFTALDIDE